MPGELTDFSNTKPPPFRPTRMVSLGPNSPARIFFDKAFSMDDWIASPEVSAERGKAILDWCRTAPDAVRAVHPIEIRPDGTIWCNWRWVVVSAFKAA